MCEGKDFSALVQGWGTVGSVWGRNHICLTAGVQSLQVSGPTRCLLEGSGEVLSLSFSFYMTVEGGSSQVEGSCVRCRGEGSADAAIPVPWSLGREGETWDE